MALGPTPSGEGNKLIEQRLRTTDNGHPSQDFQSHFFSLFSNLANRPHAGGAARSAGTFCNQFLSLFQQRLAHAEERFAEPNSARIFIVEVDVGLKNFGFWILDFGLVLIGRQG